MKVHLVNPESMIQPDPNAPPVFTFGDSAMINIETPDGYLFKVAIWGAGVEGNDSSPIPVCIVEAHTDPEQPANFASLYPWPKSQMNGPLRRGDVIDIDPDGVIG